MRLKTSSQAGGARLPLMVRDLWKNPTFGDRIITNPSSAALSSKVQDSPAKDPGLQMACADVETGRFKLEASAVVFSLIEVEGCGEEAIGSAAPDKALVTRR
uniref:Uncharacterized protein n=1 Tax=Opuntia streptacantha TaxID=393608 RepID=A0A7C9D0E0_OPUST